MKMVPGVKETVINLSSIALGFVTALVLFTIVGYCNYSRPLLEHGMLTVTFLFVLFGSCLGWLTILMKRYG
jgi:hypothetical protein